MKLRAPAVPIIAIDPFFTVWSPDTRLNVAPLAHWSYKTNTIIALANIDGVEYSILGYSHEYYKMTQVSLDVSTFSTRAVFEEAGVRIHLDLTSPTIIDDLELLTRPVSYMAVSYESIDGASHSVSVRVIAREDVCLDGAYTSPVVCENVEVCNIHGMRLGNSVQKPLNKSGDDVCIDWGYFYLTAVGDSIKTESAHWWDNTTRAVVSAPLSAGEERLFLFAYDDIFSIEYFGKQLKSYWNREGKDILTAINEAACDYKQTLSRCNAFSDKLFSDACAAGGEKYAELLMLAYRQVIAAHKLAIDENGDILYISKECFSNGCAATVDVSYPSTPMFLYYNPELVKGMMRPIYRYAESAHWKDELGYDFAPHDAGQYPLVNGQVYGKERNFAFESQMPVEECGNMIIMETNVALATGDVSFAASHLDTLKAWCNYLIKYGTDPENQLCTDDFAGHLAHNCNLSLKAIMGIAGMSIILSMLGDEKESAKYMRKARKMAKVWMSTALNADGSSKLAFDKEGTWSMKYNMVWDKIWGTRLFTQKFKDGELAHNLTHLNRYGLPLDCRTDYTKSDWLCWTATMSSSRRVFEKLIGSMWLAYNDSPSRVAMTDWYDTKSSYKTGFIHRTVQGGLYIKLLDESGKLKVK